MHTNTRRHTHQERKYMRRQSHKDIHSEAVPRCHLFSKGRGKDVLEETMPWGGGGDQEIGVTKMAQQDFSNGKFGFFPQW